MAHGGTLTRGVGHKGIGATGAEQDDGLLPEQRLQTSPPPPGWSGGEGYVGARIDLFSHLTSFLCPKAPSDSSSHSE